MMDIKQSIQGRSFLLLVKVLPPKLYGLQNFSKGAHSPYTLKRLQCPTNRNLRYIVYYVLCAKYT